MSSPDLIRPETESPRRASAANEGGARAAVPKHGIGRLTKASLVLLAATGVGFVALSAPERGPDAVAAGAYPPPAPTATTTPAPDGEGYFPPPAIAHEIVPLGASPHADLLTLLRDALQAGDHSTLASWAATSRSGLALEYPTSSEGFGVRMPEAELDALLADLFDQGSTPLIQGYFGLYGCAMGGPEPCAPIVVTTGWSGPVAMPTKSPTERIGPQPPADVPVGAAGWTLARDYDGPYWAAWWLGDGYYSLVEALAAEGHGTYTVVR